MIDGKLVKIMTSDGLEHAGFFVDAKSDIAVFHSHGTAGDFYTHKFIDVEAAALAKMGISFLTANNRGHDVYADIRKHTRKGVEWVQIGGGFEEFEDCLYDFSAWIDFLAQQGVKKVILQGHSLVQKIMYYQYKRHDPRVVGQILLSPQNDAGIMYYLLGSKKYESTNRKIGQLVKNGKGNTLLSKEFSPVSYQTSALMYSGYLTEYGAGTLTPYHSPKSKQWSILERTKEPTLVVFGGADVYMKPSVETAVEVTRNHMTKSIGSSVVVIPHATHSYIGYEEDLVRTIIVWIKSTPNLV